MSYVKHLVRRSLRTLGYEIRKYPLPNHAPVPIFDMAVQLLMCTRGERLTFIQVGANDGRHVDPLRKYILKYPWTGILVEPQPDVFKKLQANYKGQNDRLSFENIAISGVHSSMTMYRCPAGRGGNQENAQAVTSFNRNITARQLGMRPRDLEELVVACSTLDGLIVKYRLNAVDLLQIDAEGYDWEVLKTLDLEKIRPVLIQFEHGHLSPNEINHVTHHLTQYQYRLHYGSHQSGDSLAVRADLFPLPIEQPSEGHP